MAEILGCIVVRFPTTHIGRNKHLSVDGRLVNSVLNGIPTYLMSLLPIPSSFERRINRVRNGSPWEGNSEKRRMHLVKWNDVMFGLWPKREVEWNSKYPDNIIRVHYINDYEGLMNVK